MSAFANPTLDSSPSRIWDYAYSSDPSFFGEEPSILAKESLPFLIERRCRTILELGCGQGRDALFFAKNGFRVHAVDCAKIANKQLTQYLSISGLADRVQVSTANLPDELPAIQGKIDAVYSHLFLCMPFNDEELTKLFDFVYDILPENGLHIFSIRSKVKDKAYGKGKKAGRDTFEINGFTVRFFDEKQIQELNYRFKTLKMLDAYEEPCELTMVFSQRSKS